MCNLTIERNLQMVVLATMLASWGCAAKSNHSAVEGNVTLDGQPLAEGTIQFFPEDVTKGQTAGTTIKDGKYRLESSPGAMRVVINSAKVTAERKAYDDANSPTIKQTVEQIPAKYSTDASELRANVEQGKINTIDFPLTSDGEKPKPSVFQ